MAPADPRIVYGARCLWWDSIEHVGRTPEGPVGSLPACPVCGSVLYEVENEAAWWAKVDEYAAKSGDDTYRPIWEWSRGRCYASWPALKAAWRRAVGLPDREPQHEDALAAFAFLVATQLGGKVELDTAAMASAKLDMQGDFKPGPDGQVLLVFRAQLARDA